MSTYYVASDDITILQPDPEIGGGRDRTENAYRGPGGVSHAVMDGDDHSACGIPTARLYRFPDVPWGGGGMLDRCGRCGTAVTRD